MTKRILALVIAVTLVALTFSACGKATYAYEASAPSLCKAYEDYFEVGAAINTWNLENGDEGEIIKKHFNVLTLENEAKADAVHPRENRYNFKALDRFMEYGEKYDVTLRGHTLIWHYSCPSWFFKDDNGNRVSGEVLMERLKEHVTTIVSHCKGRIDTWDVVNEAFNDYGIVDTDWSTIIGDLDGDGDKYDFIEQAFLAAREAAPDARLIYNEAIMEVSSTKSITVYNAVRKMLLDGIPIDGIGLQMHIGYDTDVEVIRENMKILARLREIDPDFILEVTELDVSIYGWGETVTDRKFSGEIEETFNKTYKDLFRMLMELSKEGIVDTVVMWGLSDANSWLNYSPIERENYPMLIGREFKLKEAFWEVLSNVED